MDGGNPSGAEASGPGPPPAPPNRAGIAHGWNNGGVEYRNQQLGLKEEGQARGGTTADIVVPEPKAMLDKVKAEAKEVREREREKGGEVLGGTRREANVFRVAFVCEVSECLPKGGKGACSVLVVLPCSRI